MDDSPLQQHVKIEEKTKLGEVGKAARCRANSHPSQLTWFFLHPNILTSITIHI
jgi:hypothetical protein